MAEFNWEERLKAEYAELKKRYEKLRAHNIRLEVKANLAQTKISLSYHTTKIPKSPVIPNFSGRRNIIDICVHFNCGNLSIPLPFLLVLSQFSVQWTSLPSASEIPAA